MSSPETPPKGGNKSDGYMLIIVVSTTFVPALLAVLLRVYTRAKVVHSLGWDDWIMLLAIASAFTASGVEIVAATRGLGSHAYYLTPAEQAQTYKYADMGQAFCITALSVAKISMCISLLRIISGSDKKYVRVFLNFMIFLQFAVDIIVCSVEYAQCRPISKVWDSTIPGTCWPPHIYYNLRFLHGAVSGVTDLLLAAIPIYVIKDLHLSWREKISLCILMGMGSVTGIIAAVKLAELIVYENTNDPSWTVIRALMWGGAERNVGIIVACIPFLRPLLQTPFVKSLLSLASRTTSSNTYRRSGYSVHSEPNFELSNKVPASNVRSQDSNGSTASIVNHGVGFAENKIAQSTISPV